MSRVSGGLAAGAGFSFGSRETQSSTLGPGCPGGDGAEADATRPQQALGTRIDGIEEAIGGSQIGLYLGTYVRTRLAFTIELSALSRAPWNRHEMPPQTRKQGRVQSRQRLTREP
jgi:hypothetical protein